MGRKQNNEETSTTTQHSLDRAADDNTNSEPDGQEVCIICADPITWYAVGPCNHRTCHVCTLRLRALYKNTNCTYCKAEQPSVVFTTHPSKPFEEYTPQDLEFYDERTKISFDNKEIFDETMIFLLFNCPDKNCDVSCNGGWTELKSHVKTVHHRMLCDLCTRFKKVFCHEHTLFTNAELDRHLRGEVLQNEIQLSGFKGHPKCGFCRIAFYGDDELFDHCRKNHEQCFLCQRMGIEGARNQYFANYDTLEKHFRSAHMLCEDEECLAQKFVAFSTDIDFKAHLREKHPRYNVNQGRQRSDQKRAMQVQVNFTYGGGSDQTGNRRGDNDRERGRNNAERESNASTRGDVNRQASRRPGNGDPDIFSLPVRGATAQTSNTSLHPGREQNVRQQRTVRAPAGFGGFITVEEQQAIQDGSQNAQANAQASRRQRQKEQWPGLGEATSVANNSSNKGTSSKAPPGFGRLMDDDTPVASSERSESSETVDPETAQRHAAFLRQVAGYLQNDNDKIQQFRKHVSAYRGGVTPASQFVDSMARFFSGPNSVDVINKVMTRLVDLLGSNEEKGLDLLRAWNDKKITKQGEGYANIGPGTTAASVAAGIPAKTVTRKVLVIKSRGSTSARSGKPGARETWDRIAKAASSTSSTSPLQQQPSSPAPTTTPYFANSGTPSTAWTGSSIMPSSPAPLSVQPTPGAATQPVNNRNSTRPEAFPMLPRASTPTKPQWGKQGTGNMASSAWSSPKVGGTKGQEEEDFRLAVALSLSDNNEVGAGRSSKKKKGKEKKVLLHFG